MEYLVLVKLDQYVQIFWKLYNGFHYAGRMIAFLRVVIRQPIVRFPKRFV